MTQIYKDTIMDNSGLALVSRRMVYRYLRRDTNRIMNILPVAFNMLKLSEKQQIR